MAKAYFSAESSLGTASAFSHTNSSVHHQHHQQPQRHFAHAALDNSNRALLANDCVYFVDAAAIDPETDSDGRNKNSNSNVSVDTSGGPQTAPAKLSNRTHHDDNDDDDSEQFAISVTCMATSASIDIVDAMSSPSSSSSHCSAPFSSPSLSSPPTSSTSKQQQTQQEQPQQQEHHQSRHVILLWQTRLVGIRINHVVGLTMLELLDGPLLVLVLRNGFMMLQPRRGKPIALGALHNNNSNSNSNSNSSRSLPSASSPCFIMPFAGISNTTNSGDHINTNNMAVVDVAPGGVVVAGLVNPITGLVMSHLRCGIIHQQQQEAAAASPAVTWIKLPDELGLPRCIARNFNSAIAVAFDGAPHVFLWLEQQKQQASSSTSSSVPDMAAASWPSSSDSPAAAAAAAAAGSARSNHGSSIRSFQLSAAFQLSSVGINPITAVSQQQQRQQLRGSNPQAARSNQLVRPENEHIRVECSFLAVTTITWVSDSVLVAGSSCGHVSCIDLTSGTTHTALEQVTAVRLPSRSAVPASVSFLVQIAPPPSYSSSSSSSPPPSSSHHSDSLTMLCMTSRCDLFVVSLLPSRTVTHALFCKSELFRQPLLLDGLLHQSAGAAAVLADQSSNKRSCSSTSSLPSTIIHFICQETSIDNAHLQHIVKLNFSLDAAALIKMNAADLAASPTAGGAAAANSGEQASGDGRRIVAMDPYRRRDQQRQLQLQQHAALSSSSSSTIRPGHLLLHLHSLVGGGSEAIQNGSFGINAPAHAQRAVKKWLVSSSSSPSSSSCEEFGGYLLRQLVGQGEFGEVWMVTSIATKKIFALKRLVGGPLLLPSAASSSRLQPVGGGGGCHSPVAGSPQHNNNNNSVSAASVGAAHALHNEETVLQLPPHANVIQCIESVEKVFDQYVNNNNNNNHYSAVSSLANTPLRSVAATASAAAAPPPASTHKALILSFAFGGSLEDRLQSHCIAVQQQQQQQQQQRQQPSQHHKSISDLELVSWLVQLLSGLAHLHRHSVLHRDVKPANCLDRGSSGGGGRFCWADFGVSRNVGGSAARTKVGTTVGTPAYHAPEMLQTMMLPTPAPASAASDVWSLAAMFYCILCCRPKGTAPNQYEMRPVLEGLLPTLEQLALSSSSSPSSEQQQQQQPSLSPSGIPLRYLKVIDCMMRLDRKERPTAQQCLAAMRVAPTTTAGDGGGGDDNHADAVSAAASFFHLGSNSHLLRHHHQRHYLLYHYDPHFLVASPQQQTIMFATADAAARSRIFLGMRIQMERLEFWPLAGLLPSSTASPSNNNNHNNNTTSGGLNTKEGNEEENNNDDSSTTIPCNTSPRVIVCNMTVILPNKALADAVRVGVVATSLAPDSASCIVAGAAALAEMKSKSLLQSLATPTCGSNKNHLHNLIERENHHVASGNNNNNNNNQQVNKSSGGGNNNDNPITLPPPRYISNCVTLAPLLSMSVSSETHRVDTLESRSSSHPAPTSVSSSTSGAVAQVVNFNLEFSLPNAAIVSLPQWIDNAAGSSCGTGSGSFGPTEGAKRINKACRAVLKFVAYCNSEPALRLPVTSFTFEECFVDPTTETIFLPRCVNPLTVALVVDASDSSLDNCASSGVLANMLLHRSSSSKELREYAHLMSRSTLDSVLVVIDSFNRAFEALRDVACPATAAARPHQHAQQQQQQQQQPSPVIRALTRAVEFVSLHTQALQIRKALVLGKATAPASIMRALLEKDDADPDDTLSPELGCFFSL